jgi:hypothetical protein
MFLYSRFQVDVVLEWWKLMNDDGARVASLSLRAPRIKDAASFVLAAHASFSRLSPTRAAAH